MGSDTTPADDAPTGTPDLRRAVIEIGLRSVAGFVAVLAFGTSRLESSGSALLLAGCGAGIIALATICHHWRLQFLWHDYGRGENLTRGARFAGAVASLLSVLLLVALALAVMEGQREEAPDDTPAVVDATPSVAPMMEAIS